MKDKKLTYAGWFSASCLAAFSVLWIFANKPCEGDICEGIALAAVPIFPLILFSAGLIYVVISIIRRNEMTKVHRILLLISILNILLATCIIVPTYLIKK